MAIISYYDDPLLDELYPDEENGGNWYRETFQAARQVVNGNYITAKELLSMNLVNRQITLF
ncbi:hypothetical protein KP014_18240 [Paenibacillus sophorae]|uniref:Uncharacterized protein n=1 Tax=Paenibacillus sophorae TaxID=1333845 RepID=A0ABX8H7Y7_9BACL|nr:hypothetical protein [Paenibacillus sophorae]QWU13887.1 hypothetical protein KP014_18240 [Paenibacillus sophorae]